MAALDFPASPSNGQTYTGPGGVVWTWDGSKWVTQGIATAYLPLAGGQMTGPLGAISGGPPTASINFGGTANTGIYGNANLVGIMSGGAAKFTVDNAAAFLTVPLTLPAAPTTALQAATKGYVDGGFLPLTGGTLTGNLTLAPASGSSQIEMKKGGSGQFNLIWGKTAAVSRWVIIPGNDTAETGTGNTGSDFEIRRYSDAGAEIGVPLTINRATGKTTYVTSTVPTLEVRGVAGNPPTSGSTRTGLQYLSQSTDTAAASIGVRSGGAGFWLQSHDAADQAVKNFLLLNPSGGNVGIRTGTGNVPGALCVAGQAAAGGVVTQIWSGPAGSDTSTWMMAFYAFDASTVVGGVARNGTNTVAYNTTSDLRLKDDLQSFDAGPIIDSTNVYDFAWTETGERAHGVAAQEAIEVYPEAVTHSVLATDDGNPGAEYWGVDYSKYVPVLLQEMKALRARMAALEGGTPTP